MTTTAAPPSGTLYVDMDGVLLASDSNWESLLRLIKQRPLTLALLPIWLMQGRPYVKRQLCQRFELDPASLPYRPGVLEFIRRQRAAGRRVVLATASDRRMAEGVAHHLNLFDSIIATDGDLNLKGEQKRRAIEADAGGAGWDYIGDSVADLQVWRGCRTALLAGARPGT